MNERMVAKKQFFNLLKKKVVGKKALHIKVLSKLCLHCGGALAFLHHSITTFHKKNSIFIRKTSCGMTTTLCLTHSKETSATFSFEEEKENLTFILHLKINN